MTTDVKVPELPESVADANLVNWHYKVGDYINEGDNLVDLETDKVVLEMPAPISGVLKEIKVEDGSVVEADTVVAIMEASETASAQPAANPAEATSSAQPSSDNNSSQSTRKIASTEVKVPELPESVADANLVNWHYKIGDYINEGDNLVDLETDKVVLEMPAPISGILKEIRVEDGSTVEADAVVAIMGASENSAETAAEQPAAASPAESTSPAEPVQTAQQSSTTDKNSSPAARKIAAEAGIDTSSVAGSGRGGRVTKNDVQQLVAGGGSRLEERVPMTRMRKRIAERLLSVKDSTAMLTTFNEVDMKPIMDLRKKYQDQFVAKNGIKLGFMSFFVQATVAALKEWPAVNASIDGDDLLYHNYQDIGIAVSSPRGLVVPILRNAENLNFSDIELGIKDFATKAQNASLSMEEMTGGTFTITNGGTFGSMLSTPILNPPQSAILGMHNIVERAVVEKGEIVIRPMMYLALSYDHRIIDGREAVGFLVSIKNAIEDPTRLLLNV